MAQRFGERGNEGWARCLLGDLALTGGTTATGHAEARHHYRAALAIAGRLGMRPLHAHCLRGLVRLNHTAGSPSIAEKQRAAVDQRFRELNMKPWPGGM